jgi:excisionase family DNA binding protein
MSVASSPGPSPFTGKPVTGESEAHRHVASVLPGDTPSARVLTVIEVAHELRCSKAHVHHLIGGKVPGARPLPSLWLGRRRLILRATLDEWIRANEHAPG